MGFFGRNKSKEKKEETKWECSACHRMFKHDDSYMRRTKIEEKCELFTDACSKKCTISIFEKDLITIKNCIEE